ncbi:MAG: DUF4382 domain-containing protein [Niabella sp.]
MKTIHIYRSMLVLPLAFIILLSSCAKNENSSQQGNTATVQLVLTDAPANYDAVLIHIKEVRINVGNTEADGVPEGSAKGQWISYPLSNNFNNPVNLLDLRNGDYMYMGDPIALPPGKISQIRLILADEGNAVVIGNTPYELKTPSAQQSGLKINFHQTLSADGIYKIWLDFDAARSIVAKGNGGYNLKPVIKAFAESTSFGAIKGVVLPEEAGATVYLMQGNDTLATAIPETANSLYGMGFFRFTNINPGIYQLSINANDITMYKDSTVSSANVIAGMTTALDTIYLHK